MNLLLDEMHSPTVAERLRERGHDAVAIAELPELRGLPDEEVLAAATLRSRALVTENVKDYAPLHQRLAGRGERHAGLIFTHPRRFRRRSPQYVRELVDALDAFLAGAPPGLNRADSFTWWLTALAPKESGPREDPGTPPARC